MPGYDFGGPVDWAKIPAWDGSNAPPLSVSDAIRIGQGYLVSNAPPRGHWDLQSIALSKGDSDRWEYELVFHDDSRRVSNDELLRVLMNGQVGRMKMK